ncbi:outer membrane protein [Parasulfitobacter algicola]|uniref:Outer membrane beta-barrel protein n=1 Tax=Parasulfitobacter algicola TaxID=2614809 RepID=A0ABX2IMM5_9RHOB|nr:outer membrane beta-barrel protein [Sulfitobacter algicola]NSX54134.1 outer membrane beta-barrel protein [Sulfitobacter algicola]
MSFRMPLAALMFLAASPALAELEISVYTGVQTAPHSSVEGNNNGVPFDFGVEWEGRSGDAPPYYGLRLTWWQNEKWGYGVEMNHAKVYADDDTLRDSGFTDLEFTDGLNLVTINGFRRWQQDDSRWTPYVGAGVGLAIPHVDIQVGSNDTFGYQITGPAVVAMAGVNYEITDTWSVFGEYKGSFSSNTVDLDGGGDLQTDIVTNALNLGLSFNF